MHDNSDVRQNGQGQQRTTNESHATSPSSFDQAPSIVLPKGGGAIRGIGEKFAANPVTGTGSMTVPIATSPGRSGFGPQLSLSYDSGAGNGPFGFGWNLSLPSITRKTDKGLPQYHDADESDVFILSGAEDLVPVFKRDPQGNLVRHAQGNPVFDEELHDGHFVRRYRPRIEGLFARIERWTRQADGDVHWRSISKDNILTLYGKDDHARIADPIDPSRVFSWLICETRDDKGNAVIYEYTPEDGTGVDLTQAHEHNRGDGNSPLRQVNRYIKHIRYGNRNSLLTAEGRRPRFLTEAALQNASWMFEVVFDYGEHHSDNPGPDNTGDWLCRHDPFSSYRAGFEVRTYRLCQRVLMFHHFPGEAGVGADCLVRSTDFTYRDIRNNPDDRTHGHPIASFIATVSQSGYTRAGAGGYLKKSLPPLEFAYSDAVIGQDIHDVDPASLDNLPYGVDGATYQWVDLDGEGLSGVLTEQGGGWFYKRNESALTRDAVTEEYTARFAPVEQVARIPAGSPLTGGHGQFLDLAGDGQVDVVAFERPVAGFYERTNGQGWEPFRAFRSLPNLAWNDPNLKFIDLTGDGHADVLITEDQAFIWYSSLAEKGFGAATRISVPTDEERGPHVVFADGTQTISLADLSGDGLTDIVRIRNGEVCYWPNLGYGRFGTKVTMDDAPWFDTPEQFDPRRLRLADIDGSGMTDIIYLGRNRTRFWFNQSGNGWSQPNDLPGFPPVDNVASVTAVDLLGNGTACLVWSSPLPGASRAPMQFLNLMAKGKPHLLVRTVNNLGAETRVHYAPSTSFYLQDKYAGKPWVTKLPFPVHVVERVETFDAISQNRFVTRYAYHHGYFDGPEREFRGFGMVEQLDTEEMAALTAGGTLPAATNVDEASHVPPVCTRTWFHTGAFLDESHISKQFEHEYYREGDASASLTGLTDAQLRALLLDDTLLPSTLRRADGTRTPYMLSTEEVVEACRALKGAILRQEIYALDGTDEADRPYSTSERNYTIELLQPRDSNRHAVFFTHAREQVDFHYERTLVEVNGQKRADPRVSQAMTLEVDGFGNALRSVAVGYRRRALPGVDAPEQQQTHLALTVNRFANRASEQDWYRIGLPVETRTYEIVKPLEPTITDTRIDLFRFEAIAALTAALFPLDQLEPGAAQLWPYEKWDWHKNAANAPGDTRLRLIEHVRTLYRRDDLTGSLVLGQVESLALPFESYKLAFTAALAQQLFVESDKLTTAALNGILGDEGKYVHSEGDANWWIPSGRIFYSPGSNDPAAQELGHARTHFFLPHRYRDPFHTDQRNTETVVTFDDHRLLVVETRDALVNTVHAQNDYRVLAPRVMTDPNGNRSEVEFDVLGMVVATAVKGKLGQNLGDLLEDFDPDPPLAALQAFVTDPRGQAASLLGKATTRIVYDLDRYQRSGQPPFAATLARETHFFDPGGALTKIQVSFSYSDGLGREFQKKIQAERGDAPQRSPDVTLPGGDVQPGALVHDAHGTPVQANTLQRWVGSGRTVFNNKGKPVRQYEPFFSSTQLYEDEREMTDTGVSPILFYDPVERVVATLHPNHTYEKVVFDPWQQTSYDVNDTVLNADGSTDPKSDEDVKGFFSRLPGTDYLPTWYERRSALAANDPERVAAEKAAVHRQTPTLAHLDTLGRTFLTFADNGPDPAQPGMHLLLATRVLLDIEGNQREVIDAKNRVVMRYDYDMLGTHIHQASMEAGARWMLNNVAGKPMRAWDDRNFMRRMTYDALQRPTGLFVTEPAGERLAEHTMYGEDKPSPTDTNHRGKVWQVRDDAGIVTSDAYDFKGGLLSGKRDLRTAYQIPVNWAQLPTPATSDTFTSSRTFDALGRVIEAVAPDGSVTLPRYNDANLLEAVKVRLSGAAQPTPFVRNIDYDAKGQRTRIEYNNDAMPIITEYTYDPDTFRLTHLVTTRPNHPEADKRTLQALRYTYDPAGNITHIQDDAQQTIYFRNQRVEPSNDYVYDAVYRLISAQGREHLGQTGGQRNPPTAPDAFNQFHTHLDHPANGDALGTYVEEYEYDAVGNFKTMHHRGSDPAHPGWTRSYAYNEPSLVEPATQKSNRLSSTQIGAGTPEAYTYDVHGNMTALPHLPTLRWDFEDQLTQVDLQGGGTAYYVYDAGGQRVRKVVERNGATVEERIYLGGYEVYRKRQGGVLQLERQTLHVMDDKQRIALVETRTQGNDGSPPQLIRYQFGNHLGSASLELDDRAQIISYEEYYPYGSTSYQGVRSQTEVPKRYRYTGKERDEESGLYYHGARYYAPWLGRWESCDPARLKDGVNSYSYARSTPINLVDPSGLDSKLLQQKDDTPSSTWDDKDPYLSMYNNNFYEFFKTLQQETRFYEQSGKTLASDMFAPIEIQTGLLLSRAQRYNAFMTWMDHDPANLTLEDLDYDPQDRNYFLTEEEFYAEYRLKVHAAQQEYNDHYEFHFFAGNGSLKVSAVEDRDNIYKKYTNTEALSKRNANYTDIYHDYSVGMPVFSGLGFGAGAFHVSHTLLHQSTEEAASYAGMVNALADIYSGHRTLMSGATIQKTGASDYLIDVWQSGRRGRTYKQLNMEVVIQDELELTSGEALNLELAWTRGRRYDDEGSSGLIGLMGEWRIARWLRNYPQPPQGPTDTK